MCGTTEHVEDEFFADVDEVAFGTDFKLFEMPVLGKLKNSFYELCGG